MPRCLYPPRPVSVLLTRVFRSTGHVGKHGHEFLDFEYSSGRLRYANSSNYRNDTLIRKESACCAFLKRSIQC